MSPSRSTVAPQYRLFRTTTLVKAIVFGLSITALPVSAQQRADKVDDATQTLDQINVTGTHLRRVDAETASPVIVVDRQRIEDSGKSTLGQLLQQLPAMAGFMPGPALNSGFSHGRALVSLRNLGPERTLVLVNGHRMAGPASSVASAPGVDVNAIPASMVERVEVLTDGASSVYGSDAIGGVVNVILKDRYDGFAATVDYAQSTHGDANSRTLGLEWGKTWERGGVILGLSRNSMNPVFNRNRSYAAKAVEYLDGQVSEIRGGNTRAFMSDGRVLTPAQGVAPGPVGEEAFRPYQRATDSYNVYDAQYLITPLERTNASLHGSFEFTPNVQGYMDVFWTRSKTTSRLDAFDMEMQGAADNYYNPFGDQLDRYLLRSTQANTRVYTATMFQTNIVAGLRGRVEGSSWQWDAAAGYARYKDTLVRTGFSIASALNNAVGASFLDSDGVVKCGAPGAVIAGCTPINIFNPNDPATIAALRGTQRAVDLIDESQMRFVDISANGDLFTLPAGMVQAAVGLVYRTNKFAQGTSSDVAAADADGNCDYNDGCILKQGREESVREAYAELLVPLLKDVPFANTLNLNLGSRYSKYDAWGATTNSKVGIEWRPVANLLVRATGSQVFRAPALGDLYGSPYTAVVDNTGEFQDTCEGLTGTPNPACANVPNDGSFTNTAQFNVVTSGANNIGFQLEPERGRSYNVGIVYDPDQVRGLSLNVDSWRVVLDDMLSGVGLQQVVSDCFEGRDAAFCPLIQRDAAGQLTRVSVPFSYNSGKVDIRGYDAGIHYILADTAWGDFTAGLDATFFSDYRFAGDAHNYVGENSGWGNMPRWRAVVNLAWDNGPWHASWTTRYLGRTVNGSQYEDFCADTNADGSCRYFQIGSVVYHNASLSRKISSLHSTLAIGVDNLADRAPPRFYSYSNAANTDATTYDTLGRYFWSRLRVEF
ncbi:TonB-dependent receptor domain-containing protein [Xanthomonas arboricola pv. juglandis]|uniref:TonB-dependent receptor domain-containing protein n=1 Tax=Xanthomonas arboricola TaxID=56448 RepID=UPI0003162DC4|nr:TonB-dependent receptor [Xanthomonas arboricola]MDN0222099.1 TonB-dependent receptor [Xanthomonas arboricola pv. juglandis]MDN0226257.1 TonB-dependent receptor [Xanthomonas arboricola pv. juglandis]MDN0230623.1 TonB-dependent receptor [Xanthomonas arboricola pv. juglandis]MDN0234842.1 TonB-dependent receptor [Xanthomonas arboricola pv. juglandis]MDN0239086.1 TonB-dependent receptor [Xanthomonas arboricola pv. juglandis]